jgi:nicotinate-nucleotide pyrophosphorylase (carboxylating)
MDVNILKKVIKRFLQEDIGSGDLTSEATIMQDQSGTAEFIAKGSFMVCGIETVAPLVFTTQNPIIEITHAPEPCTAPLRHCHLYLSIC